MTYSRAKRVSKSLKIESTKMACFNITRNCFSKDYIVTDEETHFETV